MMQSLDLAELLAALVNATPILFREIDRLRDAGLPILGDVYGTVA